MITLQRSKHRHKYTEIRDKELLKKAENESYRKDNQFLHRLIEIMSVIVGLASIIVTISSIVSITTIYKYDNTIQALQNNSNSTKYMLMAARSTSGNERINNYTLAINYDDKNPFLFFSRAETYYYELNSLKAALKDCTQALNIDENYGDALLLRGKIYFDTEQYNFSIEDFEKYISIENNNDEVKTYLGYAYYFIDDFKTASQYFDNIENAPILPDCFDDDYKKEALISDCYLKLKEYSKARCSLRFLVTQRCSRNKIEFITNKLIDIYQASGNQKVALELEDLLDEMNKQYQNIKNITNDTVDIRGIETYQNLYHKLEICTNEYYE